MPSYDLSPRQKRFYTEFIDIYRMDFATGDTDKYTLVASDVQAQYWSTDNFDVDMGGFRQKKPSLMTSDRIHVHSDQDISANDVIHIKSTSKRQPDTWFKVQGAENKIQFHANRTQVYLASTLKLSADQSV